MLIIYNKLCGRLLKFVIGLFKLQELVRTPATARTEMYIRQAGPTSYRHVLKEIRKKEIYKLIIDTNPKHIHQFFRAVSTFFSIVTLIRSSLIRLFLM